VAKVAAPRAPARTIKTAIETALASGAVKKLSDHRVVHGS
jgi:hypothetical protein